MKAKHQATPRAHEKKLNNAEMFRPPLLPCVCQPTLGIQLVWRRFRDVVIHSPCLVSHMMAKIAHLQCHLSTLTLLSKAS